MKDVNRTELIEMLQSIAIQAVQAQGKKLSLEAVRELLADIRGDLDYADSLLEDEEEDS